MLHASWMQKQIYTRTASSASVYQNNIRVDEKTNYRMPIVHTVYTAKELGKSGKFLVNLIIFAWRSRRSQNRLMCARAGENFNWNRHNSKSHQDDCDLPLFCVLFLARAHIVIPHVYVILFANLCSSSSFASRDAHFKHTYHDYISQHTISIHKMIRMWKFSVCMKLRACIVHSVHCTVHIVRH